MKNGLKIFLIACLALLCGYTGGYFGTQYYYSAHNVQTQNIQNSSNIIQQNTSYKESSDIKSAIQSAYDSVVEVTANITSTDFFSQTSTGTSMGSGVIISEDGYIITNNHVIKNATSVSVKDSQGNEYEARLIGTDAKSDIAVIKIEVDGLKAVTLADSDAVELGDDAIAIGNPLGSGICVSNGIISALNKAVTLNNETMYLLQTTAAVNEGNSGGGLFNLNGDLIGIVNAKSTSSSVTVEGLGYAIPSNIVKNIATDIMANGYVKNRATLGVRLYDFPENNPWNMEKGLYIVEVIQGSAAEKAGLLKDDRITGMNGMDISSYSELSALMRNCSVGDEVEITIIRTVNNQPKEMNVKVILQEASE